jgi:tetratricopeptide (TPR) repeat protein
LSRFLYIAKGWAFIVMIAVFAIGAITASADAGVFSTTDPAQKLRDATDLFDFKGRPLPAEHLIVEAIAQYQASNNSLGLAEGYRVYALFFRSRTLAWPNFQKYYSEKGFLDLSATWDSRYAKAVEYLRKSEVILKPTDRFDLLANVYFHLGDVFVLMHNADDACRAFDQSLDAHAEFHRRNPAKDSVLPPGYRSVDDWIGAAKRYAGCSGPTG